MKNIYSYFCNYIWGFYSYNSHSQKIGLCLSFKQVDKNLILSQLCEKFIKKDKFHFFYLNPLKELSNVILHEIVCLAKIFFKKNTVWNNLCTKSTKRFIPFDLKAIVFVLYQHELKALWPVKVREIFVIIYILNNIMKLTKVRKHTIIY